MFTFINKFNKFSHTIIMKKKNLRKISKTQFGKPDKFDANGSYTGTSLLADLKPIQDADDL